MLTAEHCLYLYHRLITYNHTGCEADISMYNMLCIKHAEHVATSAGHYRFEIVLFKSILSTI